MARRLFLGRAGSGKTHACLDHLVQALREQLAPLLLVPTYAQAEHLRSLLLDRAGGIAAHCVETFSSLAERILKRPLRRLVPAAVRDRVAEVVLREFFPAAAGQPGFRAEFLSSVKEAKDQGLAPEAALAKAVAHFPEGSRGRLFFEAYARYAERFEGPDHEDLLLLARERLRSEGLTLDLLLVDGFHDFTPVQHDILESLASGARESIVTLPMDPADESDCIFATATQTAHSLKGYERVPLRGNRRAKGGIAFLEGRLFRPPEKGGAAPDIEVWGCASEEDEADRLARYVRLSARPYEEFLLLRRSFDGVHALYRAAFARHGVPLRFFGGEPLGATPAARAATQFLRSIAGNLEEDELISLLRSPYLLDGPSPAEVDTLVLARRESGAFEPPWTAPKEPKKGKLSVLLRRHLGVRRALLTAPDGDEDLARAARLFDLLQQEEAEALDALPLREGAERLARRVPLLRGATPDRRHACVYAVEAMDARQWEKPVVLVAGLTSDQFPRNVRQDLFLRDDERRAFAEAREVHLPLRSRREDEERYLFYVALTRASERMVLSYPAFDEEGTPRPPSPYLEEALLHFPDLKPRAIPIARQYVLPEDAVSRLDLLPIVADGLARVDRAHGAESALAVALQDRLAVEPALLALPRRLELMRLLPVPHLPEDPAARISASSLNGFLRCPYLYMLRRVLHADRPREHALDPALRGTIVHDALERCALQTQDMKETKDAGEIFDEVFAAALRSLDPGLDGEAQRRWMRAAVIEAAAHLKAETIEGVEQNFAVDLEGVTIRGRIDRVDRTELGPLVRDYKTGKPDIGAAERFEDIQLDLYLLARPEAVGAIYDRLRLGDSAGFVLKDPRLAIAGKQIRSLTADELAARRKRMKEILQESATRMRAGALAVAPRTPEKCTRAECDGYDLCRVARPRWLAKRGREQEE